MNGYGLPLTGMGMLTVGGTAVAYPIAAAVIAGVLIALGVALRVTGRRKKLTA